MAGLPNSLAGLPVTIKVVGVGGAGCNALNYMLEMGLAGAEFVAVDADPFSLQDSRVSRQVRIAEKAARGLDGYGEPLKGAKAAEDSLELLSGVVHSAGMVFIVSGMGSGTGTGAAPVVARLARQTGALTIGAVTRPFTFEGTRRMHTALDGIKALQEVVDTLIVVSDDQLLKTNARRATLHAAFKTIDGILYQAVRCISDLVAIPGLICLDLSDVSAFLKEGRLAQILIGKACGEERALAATRQVFSSSLLDFPLQEARGILVNITAGPDLALIEVSQVIDFIHKAARPNMEILFGAVIDPYLRDEIHVTAVANGYDRMDVPRLNLFQGSPPFP